MAKLWGWTWKAFVDSTGTDGSILEDISRIHSDEGLNLETVFGSFTVANLLD